jgi:CheY-like chemotaxis protein
MTATATSPRLEALPTYPRPRRLAAGDTGLGDRPSPRPGAGQTRGRPAPEPLPRNLVDVRVLVVDDDEATLEFLAAALGYCGAQVTVATSAAEALAALAGARPDVVVSDIAMQGHDGYWLLREIRKVDDPVLSQVPVVAATAYGRVHSQERTRAAGFAAHISKPVDPDTLCRIVGAAAGR